MTAVTAILLLRLMTAGASAAAEPARETILDLERRFSAALVERDSAAVEYLLSEDLVHIGFEGQIVGKSEYMSFFRQGDWRYTKYSTSQMVVKVLPGAAVVTGRVDRTITVSGKETTGAFAFMHVWIQAGDRWRLTSSQVTTVSRE
jgi:ketosteroid isomerase-like protein